SVYPVSAVVTSPDKCVGRGNKVQAPHLKVAAQALGVPVYQYNKVSKEGLEDIAALSPDIVVTAAFGQILSESFLAIPKYGVLNVHASLLPKYRGASPIQQAIIDGEENTGVTIMRTVKAVDAGDMLLQGSVTIGKKETTGELFDRLAILGGELIVKAIELMESGKAVFTPQNHEEATHCRMISKADGKIDFTKSAKELDCFVRGMTPWPSAYTYLDGKLLKVFEIEEVEDKLALHRMLTEHPRHKALIPNKYTEGFPWECGEVVSSDDRYGLIVAVGNCCELVRLKEIQLEGAKRMSDTAFLRGREVDICTKLG
ncbi:MAG: methionyl-tRNA formyltransferase, partial [Clostridia bacterium]|nr:methionyl-tRNA formyltransferase [Clostridia bacterium]